MAVDYNQFKGKPFQVISKLGVRYTGIFDHINQDDQTICLAQVFNHGTEDRRTDRSIPGKVETIGWVRFRTESIESLSLVENYAFPGQEAEQEDPALASVSHAPPPSYTSSLAQQNYNSNNNNGLTSPPSLSHSLPPKPSQSTISAATALSRVQHSLSEVKDGEPTQSRQPRRGGYGQDQQQAQAKAPAVPDAEFDFQKSNAIFERERSALKNASPSAPQGSFDVGEPSAPPHPASIMSPPSSSYTALEADGTGAHPGAGFDAGTGAPAPATAETYKKSSFFDNLSHSSSKVSRTEERHRNLDTFGEAGGNPAYASGGMRGGFGGRGRGRGGYQGQGQGQSQGYQQQNGGGYGGSRGGRGRGGYGGRGRGGYGQQQETD